MFSNFLPTAQDWRADHWDLRAPVDGVAWSLHPVTSSKHLKLKMAKVCMQQELLHETGLVSMITFSAHLEMRAVASLSCISFDHAVIAHNAKQVAVQNISFSSTQITGGRTEIAVDGTRKFSVGALSVFCRSSSTTFDLIGPWHVIHVVEPGLLQKEPLCGNTMLQVGLTTI